MHRSRLTALAIDVPAGVHGATASFWAGALGAQVVDADADSPYTSLGRHVGLELFVQRLGEGGPRLHLDLETDDVDAEVVRLEALGATRVEAIETWWVMRDPAGNPFCVVPPQTDDFPAGASTWP